MNKIISIVVLVVICETVYGNEVFGKLFNQAIADDEPACAKKINTEVTKCIEEKSGLPINYVPDPNDHKTLCCLVWTGFDCSAEKEKGVCTDAEWKEEKDKLDVAQETLEKGICSEYKYKPNTYSHCKP